LVVDQFEELFTLCRDEFEREAFIDNLLNLVSPGQSNTTLILTLRADFYAHLAQYPELRDAVAQRQEYIGPMTAEELRMAIEEPAKRGHWEFEPGLVDLILRDVGDEPGALPLLSHALLETWKRRAGHTLTLKGYADAGGVHGAIAHTAESIYQNLSPEEQAIARDILLRLTELGEGTEDTRRRASFEELISHTENKEEVRDVLNKLAEARLITLGEDTAEVAHEALIREWPTLREWLNQDREGLRLHRHLTEAAYEWNLLGCDPGALYRGAHLAQARAWAELHPDALNAGERAFLNASVEQEQNEELEREEQRQRELEAAQKLAETERQAASRLRIRNRVITTVGSIAVILALLAGMFGVQSNKNLSSANIANTKTVANYEQAESQRLGAEGIALAQAPGGNPETATLLAIRGLTMVYSPQADAALQLALPRLYAERVLDPTNGTRTGPLYSIAISPDGRTLFTSDLVLRDVKTGKVKTYLVTNDDPRPWGTHVAFSPDGQWALAGLFADHTARMWDVKTGKELQEFSGHTDRVLEGAFSPDGKWVITGSADQTARLWEAATGKELRVFQGHTDQVQSVAFSPDGKQVVTCSSDATIRLWDALTGQTLRIFKGHDNGVYSVVFSPDGKSLLSGSSDRTARLWDIQTGRELRQFKGHSGTIRAAIFSRDGKQILTASDDTTARLWDAETGELLRVFGGHLDGVGKAIFAPDGRSVFTASWDDTIRQWTVGQAERVFTLPASYSASLFAPDGQTILVEAFKGNLAWLEDARTGRQLVRFSGHTADIVSMVVSKDKKYVLTGSFDKTARLWDAATGQELHVFRGFTDWVNVNFSDDGKLVITWSNTWGGDRMVRVWQTASGKPVQAIQLNQPVSMAVASPDDKTIVIDTIDNVFSVWDIQSGRSTYQHQNNWVMFDLGFSPDGKYIITSGNNKMIQLWDVATAVLARTFNQPDAVNSAFYSPDGKFIWSGGLDGKVRQWDAATRQLVRVFSGPRGYSRVDEISPDGKFVLIEYDDQSIHLFDVDYQDTIRYACARLVRDLTIDEKHVYGITDSASTCPKP
jgi:WD40 repeat protein